MMFKNGISYLLICLMLLSACVENNGTRSTRATTKDALKKVGGTTTGTGNKATGDLTQVTLTAEALAFGQAELRHIVDPFDGTYKTKVTIPKNYSGILYLSGLNITSLSNRLISARFRFGRELEAITVPATIVRGQGITPQTDIEVVALDMTEQPFSNMRLLYDLYDYNDYDVDNDGTEEGAPVSSPRDGGLYCRGLRLSEDSTFIDSNSNAACDAAGERCLYAYAKIKDKGLINSTSGIAQTPTQAQVAIAAASYSSETVANKILKCLPEDGSLAMFNSILGISLAGPLGYPTTAGITVGGVSYQYKGPYTVIAETLWEISGGALFSSMSTAGATPSGVFQTKYVSGSTDTDAMKGYKSFLFPRAAKMDLRGGVDHFSSTTPFGIRTLSPLLVAGTSTYMDGCNARVTTYNSSTNENIASCNVTATIELVSIDPTTKEEIVVSASKALKLQLIKASLTDYQGKEVLYSAMKTCTNSNSCGSGECCYNSRCWSKNLVSQCKEDVLDVGNGATGASCASDYQCSSLCCNAGGNSRCGVHQNTINDQVLCSKSPGQSCVTREYCRKENVSKCLIVKVGTNSLGQQTCALRCYNVPTYGDCVNGGCIQPASPVVPAFDQTRPLCSGYPEAVDPPTSVN
jgi:hypothetical protein